MTEKTYIIGVAGPSCSGKTTLAKYLSEGLTNPAAFVIPMDDYYRDLSHLPFNERKTYNFDLPDALEQELLIEHLYDLTQGKSIEKPIYQFDSHTRSHKTEKVNPAQFLLIEGLFTLYWEELRAFLDLSIFITADDSVCFERRKVRDTTERGRTLESVILQYRQSVRPMFERYVLPTQDHADLVVSGELPVSHSGDLVLRHIGQKRI